LRPAALPLATPVGTLPGLPIIVHSPSPIDEEEFFKGRHEGRAIHRALKEADKEIGPSEIRVSKSQIGFYRRHPFAATWSRGRYLKGDVSPLVLSVFLRRRDGSPRWKKVVEPRPGRFTHHLELRSAKELDDEVRSRLSEAWREAD
jgi:hypothetical protein